MLNKKTTTKAKSQHQQISMSLDKYTHTHTHNTRSRFIGKFISATFHLSTQILEKLEIASLNKTICLQNMMQHQYTTYAAPTMDTEQFQCTLKKEEIYIAVPNPTRCVHKENQSFHSP